MPNGDAGRTRLLRATLLVVASAACFSTIAIFVTLALRSGAPLLTVLTGRFVFGVLAIAPIAGVAALGRTPKHVRRSLVYRAGVLQAALVFCSGASLRWLTAATLVFLFYTYPAWVTLIVALERNERITLRRGVALLLSLVGVTIVVGAPGASGMHPAGVAFALASAVIFAVYLVYTDRLQTAITPGVTSFWIAVGACGTFVISAALTRQLTIFVAPPVWFYMIALGVLSTAIGYGLFFKGLQELGPVRTAIISTVEPIWAAILGWMILAQPVTVGTALGGMCIAIAVVMLQWPPKKMEVPCQPAAT
ncbi:MAG: DMT family transporter [Gemmatimonadaceae bacterium]